MEEVVVEASPFAEWGFPFVKYQFVMGIGEAVMALLLCLCIALFVERVILYNTGLISSDVKIYPVPTYIWTLIFGIVCSVGRSQQKFDGNKKKVFFVYYLLRNFQVRNINSFSNFFGEAST